MAGVPFRPPPNVPVPTQHAGAHSVDFTGSVAFCAKEAVGGAEIGGTSVKLSMIRRSPFIILGSVKRRSMTRVEGARDPSALIQELADNDIQTFDKPSRDDPFGDLKNRFSRFKKQACLDNPVQYNNLAQAQTPKFMVIACADSRVCPSTVLGFQPGEAFTVRNVANIVPPFQYGPSETNAALEFAVNSLEVGNILVVGHSRCGGIHALMSAEDDADAGPLISSASDKGFTSKWVSVAKSARLRTKAAAGNQCFDMQCEHCEKESINGSLQNLLSYPWIRKRVVEGKLAIHGGYYDFVNCTFEKWTLVYRENEEDAFKYGIKYRAFWS